MSFAIKICGLKDSRCLAAAIDAGATAVGFVFASSPRQVTPAEAAVLLQEIPAQVQKVAVFRVPEPDLLAQVVDLPFDMIQASVAWEESSSLPRGLQFMPSVADGENLLPRFLAAMGSQREQGPVHVDAPGGGGLGILPDHRRIAAVAWRYPVVLAGGLTPENVAAAIHSVRPVGVDVSTGVEKLRGSKDPALIADFVHAARAAGEEAFV
ncbi:MAG: phosphoribosylanthranilate isomerase [Planctomycetota bacterium]|jgi:phosphoribosylanthranilate isomerase